MSERRCEECDNGGQTSSAPATPNPGGDPSCDSELAAIRERHRLNREHTRWLMYSDVGTLLRVVDELTDKRDEAESLMAYWCKLANDRGDERDELRAKLASAEATLNKYATALGATEAKLAEAERDLDGLVGVNAANMGRAEAAEARVRELEETIEIEQQVIDHAINLTPEQFEAIGKRSRDMMLKAAAKALAEKTSGGVKHLKREPG